jgi:hypothetical protein
MATQSLEYNASKTLSERAMALFDTVPTYIKTFGWRGLLCFGKIRYSSSRKPAPLFFRNNSKPTWLRPDSSDLLTMREVFLDRDYDFPVRDNVKYIVDAGANIGLASIFFANKYPDAKIIAIEPEKENFLLLKRNAQPLLPNHSRQRRIVAQFRFDQARRSGTWRARIHNCGGFDCR